jgi:hypothetical protein
VISGLVVTPETTPQLKISRISLGSELSKNNTHASYTAGIGRRHVPLVKHIRIAKLRSQDRARELVEA